MAMARYHVRIEDSSESFEVAPGDFEPL